MLVGDTIAPTVAGKPRHDPEQFVTVAEQSVIVPAVEALVALASQTVPPERLKSLVVAAIRIMEDVAVSAVRDIVESRARPS